MCIGNKSITIKMNQVKYVVEWNGPNNLLLLRNNIFSIGTHDCLESGTTIECCLVQHLLYVDVLFIRIKRKNSKK